ncbi:MAG: hypothetical protein Ct9H90mP30_5590 [Actinomycetota bacterium]|nr:MAG: hypothetical protein Ct9H90mP30_5590 [Actinomycetota bacterium]
MKKMFLRLVIHFLHRRCVQLRVLIIIDIFKWGANCNIVNAVPLKSALARLVSETRISAVIVIGLCRIISELFVKSGKLSIA